MLAPEFLPSWGGVGTYIVELVRHLPENIEIHIVTPMRDGFGRDKISSSDYDFSQYFGSNVHFHFVCRASDTFAYNASFQYACLKHVPKIVKEEKIDLIHSHTAHMPDLLLMFRKFNKPFVTTVHTTIKYQRSATKISGKNLYDFEKSEKATHLMYPALRLAETVYFKRKRFFITPTNWMKKWLKDNFHINGKVRVIPNSVDVSDYVSKELGVTGTLIPSELRNRRIILYAGRLMVMKGIETLIGAIPKILKGIEDNLLFIFAGPGNRNHYILMTKKMKIESYCFFTGPLPKELVVQLMKSAELVVVPSFLENCPYVILESMACGKPVVASNVGGIPEIVIDKYNGLLIKPGSSKMLAEAVIELLENQSMRNLMGQRARETIIKKFSWEVNLDRYLDAYSEALNL
jgi:glycosyltransferase involved in cell wall biosynthesis